ncbi:prohibitin family protein [Deinococcus aestuarii]|uniref:prohibitin family protein n=1 Tax=Deinococcus aestuarii TaxID=2774531 RepID=UPI001C0E4C94|nr:prohibitin family protein [Deinococcus aestuarii]
MTKRQEQGGEGTPRRSFPVRLGLIVGGLALAGLVVEQGLRVVPAGNVGVVFSALGGVRAQPLQEGVHFVTPFIDRVNLYSTRTQEVTLSHARGEGDEGAIRARSKEGLDITADVTVRYAINPARASELHQKLGPAYERVLIAPEIRSKVRDAIGQVNAADLISTQRQAVEVRVSEALKQEFARNNIVLDAVLLRELKIPESVAKAIEQKQTAEQQVAVERNRLQQANISAQRAVVEAEGAARAAVAKARGEAEALSLRGRALRENPQLIQLTVAEKLSPGINTVMLPADGNFLLDLKSLQGQQGGVAAKPGN